MTEIIRIPLGADNCYILKDRGVVVIDCGMPGIFKTFLAGLKSASIEPGEVKLIVVTHAHWDHIGHARDIKRVTGAPLALHRNEKEWLERAKLMIPRGSCLWGRILARSMIVLRRFIKITPAEVDLTIGEEGLSLESFGISGRVVHTPGHSPGSVSIVLDSGEAFVGDMAMSIFPMTIGPGFPIFADDCNLMKESWRHLLSLGITQVYPAHGRPFSVEIIKQLMTRP